MDPDLVDRIYECSFVPELWPDALQQVGRIAEAGASLFISSADVTSWTASKIAHEATAIFVKEGWFCRGQVVARLFAARHAGFLTDLDLFSPDELELEPIYRDMWLRGASDGLWARRFRFQRAKECLSSCRGSPSVVL
jgi:hypothetical protein